MKKQLQLLAILFLITNMQSPLFASPFGLAWRVYSQSRESNFESWWNKIPQRSTAQQTQHVEPGKREYRESLQRHAQELKTDWHNRDATVETLEKESAHLWNVAQYTLYATTGLLGLMGIAFHGAFSAERFERAEQSRAVVLGLATPVLCGIVASSFCAALSWAKQEKAKNYIPGLKEDGHTNLACRENILAFDEQSLKTLAESKKTEELSKIKQQLGLTDDEKERVNNYYSDLFGFRFKGNEVL